MIGSKFIGNKAGMSSIDKEQVARIIAENTSANFEGYEKKRASRIDEQIKRNRQRRDSLTEQQIKQTREELDRIIEDMEKWRRLDKIKVHIDMDAFYAAVECRDNIHLRDVPMAVGSLSMLSTSNYAARKFGVRSAMPGFIAKKLCPQLLIVPCNFSKYKRDSSVFRAVFQRYDSEVSMGSLDEAYLDLTNFISQRKAPVICRRVRFMGPCVCRLPLVTNPSEIGPEAEKTPTTCSKCGNERIGVVDSIEFGQDVDSVVRQLRFEVEQATGLTCSAGIASNSMLAKICSDLNKPNGQFRLENSREAIVSFMHTLPVRKVPGIGAVTESLLKGLDVVTCGDLLEKRSIVHLLLTKRCSEWLLRVALGISGHEIADDGEMEQNDKNDEDNPKSTSIERTFTPTNNSDDLLSIVRSLCARLIQSLPSSEIVGGRAVTLKIKFANFDVVTRCKSVNFVVTTVGQLLPIIEAMLRKEFKERRNMAIRLLGVRLSQLVFADANLAEESKKSVQLSLAGFMSRHPLVNKKRRDEPPEVVELSSSDEMDMKEEEDDETIDCGEEEVKPMPFLEEKESKNGQRKNESPNDGCDGPRAETSERSRSNGQPGMERDSTHGDIIVIEDDEEEGEDGIVNTDEYFDFVDDDDEVIDCTKSGGEKRAKNGRKGGGQKRKRRREESERKRDGNRKTNNLFKYFHTIR
ncbi:hypothetical protein niasHT_030613 [Heterodera trifolii]|uniref:DNA polymerase kappa n=1 Tax=Heterodera trifolii TaxID=157864 RepID=A0ABD2IKT6_9BILA